MDYYIPKIFRNISNQKFFLENGFCKIRFGTNKEINACINLFNNNIGKVEKYGFEGNDNFDIRENKASNSEKIIKIFKASLIKNFTNISPFYGTYLVKPTGENSIIPPHQDWTNVDESKDVSFGIWIPIEDVNTENGALFFIPGSQKITNSVRTNNPYPWPFAKVQNELMHFAKTVTCKKGEAIVINHKVIHGSHKNTTNKPRNVCIIGAKNKDAQLIHFYLKEKPNKRFDLQKIKYKDKDFQEILRNKKPKPINSSKISDYTFPSFNIDDIIKHLVN